MENLAIDITEKRNVQLAIDQLNEEIQKHQKNDAYCRIHEMLVDMVTANPELAEKILGQKEVLKMSFEAVKSASMKNGSGISEKKGFEAILQKLRITGYEVVTKAFVQKAGATEPEAPAAKKKTYVNLDDLL